MQALGARSALTTSASRRSSHISPWIQPSQNSVSRMSAHGRQVRIVSQLILPSQMAETF